jgi:hypothetical protein
MTIEVVNFKCPTCGHVLGEVEYYNACEKNKILADEKAKQKVQEQIKQLKIEHAKEVQRIKESNEAENKKEIDTRVAKIVTEENVQIELKHNQELADKDRQIQAAQKLSSELMDEKIRQAIINNEAKHTQKEIEFELQLGRVKADNKDLMAQVEKQKKTLDSIPPELRGTAGELILIDILQKEFRTDRIMSKNVGISMADVIHTIVTSKGEVIPTPIVYDKKLGEKVTKSDLEKAKNYKTVHNTDHSIIVTKDIKNNCLTEEREGILLVHPLVVIDIAKRIRSSLIETSKQTRNNISRDSKESKLYNYITSLEYTREMESRIDLKSKLDDLQRKEEDYHMTMWCRRKEFIDKWSQLDNKSDLVINDITQQDQKFDTCNQSYNRK